MTSIRRMVEESLGYVTPQEREQMHAWEKEIEAERAAAQQGSAATVVNSGLGTALDFGDKALHGRIIAESDGRVTARPKVQRRVITEEVSSQDLSPDF